LRAAGYSVEAEYYINDAGNQINNLAASVNARYLELLKVPCDFPEDGYHGEDIIATAERIVKTSGEKYLGMSTKDRLAIFRELALKEKLAILREDLEAFNVRFDSWFSEQTLHDGGEIEKCCADLTERGYMYEKDGARWLRSTLFGDDKDRVVIRENGAPTYLAADIAYHKNKFSRGFTRLVNLWGADHHGYIKRMKAACEAIGHSGGRLEILILQMVNLFRDGELVKMSKRTGQSVTLNELVEEVGTDAARFFFIMRSIDSQLDFDINLAIEKAPENPVYYIQYAHARICSVFRQMAQAGVVLGAAVDLSSLREECELELIKKLGEYEGEIESAAKDRAPHRVARFAHELTGLFHSFYQQCRILGVEENTQAARLVLARAVRDCLRHALGLLGISAPEYM
jgi:arginyl-tRNA synthetase